MADAPPFSGPKKHIMNTQTVIDIIVTRHPNLVALLIERGIVDEGIRVIEHAKPNDVRGKHVIGILPHHLSSLAASITEIPMRLTRDDRELLTGSEMPLDRMREVAMHPVTYTVTSDSYRASVGSCFAAAYMACGALMHIKCKDNGLIEMWGYDEQTLAQVLPGSPPRWRAGSNLPHCESKPWLDMFGA